MSDKKILTATLRAVQPFTVRQSRPGEKGPWVVCLLDEAVVGFDNEEVARSAIYPLTVAYNMGRAQGYVEGVHGIDPNSDQTIEFLEAVNVPPAGKKN